MVSSCYPAPFQDDDRWVHSIPQGPQKSSFPALCSIHYFTWYLSTCRHTRILYHQNCLLSTILCRLCSPFSLSGRNEWDGKETTTSVSSCCFQSWAGKLSRRISCTAGALDSRRAAVRAQHQGRQVAREQELQSLCVSLSAVEEVEPLWIPQSSSQGTARSL